MWEGRRIRISKNEEGGKRDARSIKTGGKTNRKEIWSEKENIFSFSPKILPPIFDNVAICMACGKEKHVNVCGFCEDCWITYSHLCNRIL